MRNNIDLLLLGAQTLNAIAVQTLDADKCFLERVQHLSIVQDILDRSSCRLVSWADLQLLWSSLRRATLG